MGAQSNLTLNTKVYTPRGNIAGVAKWTLAGDTTFGGASSSVTESVVDSKNGITRTKFRLTIPKAADANSNCACAGDITSFSLFNVDVTVPDGFTLAERTDACLRMQALIADAIFTSAVQDRTGSW